MIVTNYIVFYALMHLLREKEIEESTVELPLTIFLLLLGDDDDDDEEREGEEDD